MPRHHSRSADVTVTVDLDEFDDETILAEALERDLDVLNIDISALRGAASRGDIIKVLDIIERGLPSEFAGLYDQIVNAQRLVGAA